MCSPPNVRVWANRPYGLTSLAQSLSVTHLRKNCSINLIDFCLLFQFFDIIKNGNNFSGFVPVCVELSYNQIS